jgi:hypothetical protein
MTPQEQQMIQGLIDRVQKTQLPEKDAEAEQLLQQSLGRNPDALYIMAQSLLVQGYALEQAQKQLPDLKAQLADANEQLDELRQQSQYQQQAPPPPPQKHTSFLGNIFGSGDDRPAQPPAYPQQGYPQQQPQYAPVASYGQPAAYPPPAYGGPQYGQPAPPQGGGFLRGAMQTAAGVAAGAVAFEGIESLMHGFGHSGGSEGFGGFGGGGGGPREEVINNYYGDDAGRGHEGHGLSNDIEDRRDDTRFGDTGDNSGNDNSKDFADTDDTSDDSSSFDDGGSDDSGNDDSSFS